MVSKASAFKSPHNEPTVRLTVAQAVVRFLANQYVERDGERSKFFAGCFGIFGHGNVAGMGQALLQAEVEAERGGHRARAAICVGPQRAGDGAHRRRVRQAEGPAAGVGGDREHRAWFDQHAHRRRAGHHQPAARSAAAVGHVRDPGQRTGAAGPRTAARQRDDRQRRVQAAVAVLRPGVAARTAALGVARRDAGAHRPGRDRCGHHRVAAGRAGRGVRLAGIAVRRTHLACGPPAAGAVGDRAGR